MRMSRRSLNRSSATWRNWRAPAPRRTRWKPTPPTWRSSWNISRRPRPSRPSRAPSTCWLLREWLAWLYGQRLTAVTIRRKLAAVRGLFRFLLREGVVAVNVARLVRTPKAPQKLPEVMTPEQANALLDGVAADKLERPFPARDRAIFELLYGCGLRVSELAGLNLEDLDRAERWLRVRGKGRKERQVPLPGKAAEALERYLAARPVVRDEPAVFLNHAAGASPRAASRGIVKLYATLLERRRFHPPAQLPPRLRHAPAGRWRRPARHPGTAGPRAPLHHPEVHPGFAHRPDGRVRQGPPQGLARMTVARAIRGASSVPCCAWPRRWRWRSWAGWRWASWTP